MNLKLTLVILASAAVCQAAPSKDLYGYYVGSFLADHVDHQKDPSYSNKINLSIDSIQGNKVKGHSVVAGNSRPFSGTIRKDGENYVVQAREPGDDQYDGAFQFTLMPASHEVQGIWIANNKQLAVTQRRYKLQRKTFRYNPEATPSPRLLQRGNNRIYNSYNEYRNKSEALTPDAFKLNASTKELRSADVENMYKRDLEVTRNLIYARHGYSFKNRDMRYLFDQVDWYIPVSTDVTAQLTPLEKRNIELLKRYENHAESYYDRFGR